MTFEFHPKLRATARARIRVAGLTRSLAGMAMLRERWGRR